MIGKGDRQSKTSSSRGSAKVSSGGHSSASRFKRRAISQNISISDSESGSDSESPESNLCQVIQSTVQIATLPTQDEVTKFCSNNKKCCAIGTKDHSCLETYFILPADLDNTTQLPTPTIIDTTKMYQFVVALRKISQKYSEKELDEYYITQVRRCVTGRRQISSSQTRATRDSAFTEAEHEESVDHDHGTGPGDGDDQYAYNWTLEISAAGKQPALGPYKVCRPIFAFALGASLYQIRRIVKSMKQSEYGFLHSSNVRPLNDHSRYFEQYSFDDVERIMKRNVTMRVTEGDDENLVLGTFEIGQFSHFKFFCLIQPEQAYRQL